MLADRAELNVSQLRRYEAGTSEPSLAALRRLAVALSVTTDAFVFGDDTRGPDNDELRMAFEATRFLDPASPSDRRARTIRRRATACADGMAIRLIPDAEC